MRVLTGSMEPTGCAGTILKTTFPVAKYDLMSKFSRSILPGCAEALFVLDLFELDHFDGGVSACRSRDWRGVWGPRTSVPTTASSQGAISKRSYCF